VSIAAKLPEEDVQTCHVARDSVTLHEVANTLMKTANINVQVVSAERRDSAAPRQAIAEAVRHCGCLRLLINNPRRPVGLSSSHRQKNNTKVLH